MRIVLALCAASLLTVSMTTTAALAQDGQGEGGATTEGEGGTEEGSGAEGEGPPGEGDLPDGQAGPEAQSGVAGAGGEGSGAEGSGVEGETTNTATRDEGMDAGTYAVRLRDLEERINELKERIFRSKARLSLLAETVLSNTMVGGRATIVHENQMSNSYRLVKAVYSLDGAPIFNRADEEGGLSERDEFEVFNGNIVPGEHTLTVNLEYRGHGYGIFSYLKGYRFKVRSNYSFTAPEGRQATIRVVAYEKGGPTAPLEERPAIRYIERVSEAGGGNLTAAEGSDGGDEE